MVSTSLIEYMHVWFGHYNCVTNTHNYILFASTVYWNKLTIFIFFNSFAKVNNSDLTLYTKSLKLAYIIELINDVYYLFFNSISSCPHYL